MTTKTSKWKAEVKFQYGGRLFSETGQEYLGHGLLYAVEILYATRFDVLNCDTSSNRKPEVDLRRSSHHLENR